MNLDFNNITPAYGDVIFLMLGALLLFLVLFLIFLRRAGRKAQGQAKPISLRTIPAYDSTREGFSRAAETGNAVHTSPGSGGIGARGVTTAATLAGLSIVESMSRVSAITGAPVQATTNDAVAYALTDNALRRGYVQAGWPLERESGGARFLTHSDPLAYVAAAAEVAHQNRVTHAVMAGHFGPEVLFLIEAQRRSGAHQIAGASDPQALALMSITTDHTLIGEEIFASGAYLERRASFIASLLSQDGLRWAIILLIVVGFILVNVLGQEWTRLLSFYP